MQRFSTILADLRAAVAARASRTRALETLLVLVWQRLSRMAQRFERLVQLWRDGRLPKARARVAAESRPMAQPAGDQPAGRAVRVQMPTGQAWLVAQMHEAAQFGSQMQHLLGDAEMLAFLAEVPQAGRIVRPLCRMLGLLVPVPVPVQPARAARVRGAVVRAAPVRAAVGAPVRLRVRPMRTRKFSNVW